MPSGRIAMVLRGDRSGALAPKATTRLAPVIDALAEVGLAAEFVSYTDDTADEVRSRLVSVDGVLVWVDPVSGTDDRNKLDSVLRDVASGGVWVSAHPDTISKMGTKQVLYETRELGWGSKTFVYRDAEEFVRRFPPNLRSGAARVLKPARGNGGIGVQKVELLAATSASGGSIVRVQAAELRDEVTEDVALTEFVRRGAAYFTGPDGARGLIDQPFQPRITEGIVRCYLVKAEVIGFARQFPQDRPTEADPAAPSRVFGLPSAKTMYEGDDPAFQSLRVKVESEWVPAMQSLVNVDAASLPALWDADFLFGPKRDSGEDTYVLCEINVSSVLPFPPGTPPRLAQAVRSAVTARGRP